MGRRRRRRLRHWWYRTPNDHVAMVIIGLGALFVLLAGGAYLGMVRH